VGDGEDATRTGPWGWVQEWDIDRWGPEILDEQQREHWLGAFRIAGGLAYMWKELAPNISDIVYGLLEARPGDRVLVIGEAVEPCGWISDLQALVGDAGSVDSVEIIEEARTATFRGDRGRNGKYGCWQWDYTKATPEEAYDGVAIMQATQHCDDWKETGAELLRVLKPGRRIVLAEAQLSGPNFTRHANSDVHIRQWVDKLFSSFPIPAEDIPYYSPEELREAFDGSLDGVQTMEWRGIEMFWGRKPM
jgi:hypothetical protein